MLPTNGGHDHPSSLYRHDVIINMGSHSGSPSGSSLCSSHTSLLSSASPASSNGSTSTTSTSTTSSASSVASNGSTTGGAVTYKLLHRLSSAYGCLRLPNRHPCSSRAACLPLLAVCAFIGLYWYGSGYMKHALLWIETQNAWLTFAVFMCFFTVVSFPLVVGYLILIITSGYLFGCVKGLLTVVVGANVGVAIAHHTIRALQEHLPIQRFVDAHNVIRYFV